MSIKQQDVFGNFDKATGRLISLRQHGAGLDPLPVQVLQDAAQSTPAVQRLQRAIAQRAGLLQVSPVSASLTVTRGAQNGAMVSPGGQPLLSWPHEGVNASMRAAAQAGRGVWMHAPGAVATPYGLPPVCTYATLAGRPLTSPPVSFTLDGQAFEVLMGGVSPAFALMVDGQWAWSGGVVSTLLSNGAAGATMADGLQNTWVRFDFGSRAVRRIVVHNASSGGIQNVGRASGSDVMIPLDRSAEPVAVALTDSYGLETPVFPMFGGLYGEALAELGIGTAVFDAIGGTGFAPTSAQPLASNSGAARAAGLPAALAPDLVLFGLGLNDNASLADAGLGLASPAAARAAFTAAVGQAVRAARAYAPGAVLAMVGIWTPATSNANYATVGAWNHEKARIMREVLAAEDRGPWVWVDPAMGEVANSRGLQLGPTGVFNGQQLSSPNPTGVAWMTGTGTTAAPAGNGNADFYTLDGVHPNRLGTRAFGLMLAEALRTGIRAL